MSTGGPRPGPWIPHPRSLPTRGIGERPGLRLFAGILVRSGRMEAIYRAGSEAAQNRMVAALFRGPRAVEITGTDREIAAWAGMSPRSVAAGLAFLERSGHCTRTGAGSGRSIRLCLPAGREVGP